MRRRLKKYHKIRLDGIKMIIFMVIILIIIIFGIKSIKIGNNDIIINALLKSTNNYIEYDIRNKPNILDTIIDIEQPFSNLSVSNIDITYIENEIPVVYIYNTHDKEEYLSSIKDGYDIRPTIVDAAILLQDELNKRGLLTIVEEKSVSDECVRRGLVFTDSYTISREYVNEVLDKYPNLRLIIDLHRDAVDRDYSYVQYDGDNYAKTLFVMGKRYSTYNYNLSLATKIDNQIKNNYEFISRGIMINDVEGHNGVYNQDLNPNIVLLELGSNNNTFEEVYNTINVLADAIWEVFNEDKT